MKRTLGMFLALCMVLSTLVIGTGALAADDEIVTDSGTFTMQEAVERSIAWQECSNLAGKHEYYHSALQHRAELENIWVTEAPWTETMSWTNNTQFMLGEENVYGFYCGVENEVKNWLSGAMALDTTGTLTDSEEWYGTGILWYHMLMSPVIEVAKDGQTACGLWQSFGTVTQPAGGSYSAQWTCEDYTMVFAKQSDGWRIWHLRTFVHFYTNVDNHWYEQNMATQGNDGNQPAGVGVLVEDSASKDDAMPSAETTSKDTAMPSTETSSKDKAMPAGGGSQDDYSINGTYYVGFDLYDVPVMATIPEPYDTWSDIEDTFAWGGYQPLLGNNG